MTNVSTRFCWTTAPLSRSPRRTTASLTGPSLIVIRFCAKFTTKSGSFRAIPTRSARGGPLEDGDGGGGALSPLLDDGADPCGDAPVDDSLRLDAEGPRHGGEPFASKPRRDCSEGCDPPCLLDFDDLSVRQTERLHRARRRGIDVELARGLHGDDVPEARPFFRPVVD